MKKSTILAAGAVGVVLLVTGCSTQEPSDYTEIATFTDMHGRACTAAVVVDRDQDEAEDREVTALHCAYPPEGVEPGLDRYSRLPEE